MVQVSASAAETRITNLFRDDTGSDNATEHAELVTNLSEANRPAERASESHARLVFQPYVRLHSQVEEYQLEKIAIQKIPFEKQVANFYETRMLLIRICEEQLHLIQRHSDCEGDFEGSKAWQLLFKKFRSHRQSFAEMKEPFDHTPPRKTYAEVLKGK